MGKVTSRKERVRRQRDDRAECSRCGYLKVAGRRGLCRTCKARYLEKKSVK